MRTEALVLSDIHGSNRIEEHINVVCKKYDFDLAIICGDITHFGSKKWAKKFLENIPITVIGVTGNCDPYSIGEVYEEVGGINLHLSKYELNSLTYSGLSGSEHPKKELMEFYNVAKGSDVIVLHVPPKGILDQTKTGKNKGTPELLPIIEKIKPRLVLSGHAHDSQGITKYKKIKFLNPGAAFNGNSARVIMGKNSIQYEFL